jgi:amidohydrolase
VIPPYLADLRELRQQLHRHPETGFDVGVITARVADRLRDAGLDVTPGVGGGVVATLRRGSAARSIGLRADLDALPIAEANTFAHASQVADAHHGCGHDGHTAMLVGAAQLLAGTPDLDGTVHFLFQPAEETGCGAQAMIDDRLFERFPMDAVFGLHNLPGLPVGHLATRPDVLTAFEDVFAIEVDGSGGHASAPERTVDPLVTAAELVLALQTIVARSVAPGDHAVVSVTELETDGARNVIPGHVTISGNLDHVAADTAHRCVTLGHHVDLLWRERAGGQRHGHHRRGPQRPRQPHHRLRQARNRSVIVGNVPERQDGIALPHRRRRSQLQRVRRHRGR